MTQAFIFFTRAINAISSFFPFLLATIFFLFIICILLRHLFIRKKKTRTKIIAANFLFFFFFLTIALIGAEMYYRFLYDATDNLFFLQTAQRWRERHVFVNNEGFRDDNFSGIKPARTIRIGLLGDSFTYGQGIERRDNLYAEILEQSLSKTNRVEVYTIARDGLTTRDHVSLLLDKKNPIAQYQFDLLLLAYVLNDFRGDTISPLLDAEAFYYRIRLFPVLKQIFDHSYAIEFLVFHLMPYLDAVRGEEEHGAIAAYNDPAIWSEHTETLKFLTAFSRKTRTPLAVIILPFLQHVDAYPARGIHQKLRAFFTELGLPLIDMLDVFADMDPSTLMVNRFDAHPNEHAQQIIAQHLESFLRQNNLLQERSPIEDGVVDLAIPDCTPAMDAVIATASAQEKLKEGYALPPPGLLPLPVAIETMSQAWRARLYDRGLWISCPRETVMEYLLHG